IGRFFREQDSTLNCFCVQISLTELSKFLPASSSPGFDAQSYCRKFHTDLASIRNEEERTRVQQEIPRDKIVYVGLHRNTWSPWSDGTEHKFKNWLTGHPLANTGDCATSWIGTTNAGKWVEDRCDQKLPFMCHPETGQCEMR
uniref:C-type lectin domain-containing protein n=1 Tax=Acanthochromis polyacanthus TaxID=80966 RepID=A0A3Q1G211_9TELE